MFITAITRARNLSLSSASSIQSIVPHPNSWRSILPNLMSHFPCLGRTKLSAQVRGKCLCFVANPVFFLRRGVALWLSPTAYSIYPLLPSILEIIPPSATWGRPMPWWQTHLSRTTSWTFNKFTFMCFVWIWEQTAIISLYSIDWLLFITEAESVYCAVRSTFYVLPTHCIYVFCMDLRTHSDYFTVQH